MKNTKGSFDGGDSVPQNMGAVTADGNGNTVVLAKGHFCSHLRLWLTAAIGVVADLWTKNWAFTCLESDPQKDPLVIIPHIMTFRQSLNPGALFGMGKGLTALFIGASILALGFVFFLFLHSSRDRRSLHCALGLVLAGALGNLYDRTHVIADVVKYTVSGQTGSFVGKVVEQSERGVLVGTWPSGDYPRLISNVWAPEIRSQGVVRDFVKMEPKLKLGNWSIEIWPWVFNVADAMLVVGVGVLMLNFWWDRRAESCPIKSPVESLPSASV